MNIEEEIRKIWGQINLLKSNRYAMSRRCLCQATHNANQATANATWVVMALNTTTYDYVAAGETAMHSNAVNNSRIYARIAGVYGITAQLTFASNATGLRLIGIAVNLAGVPGAFTAIVNAQQFPAHPSSDSGVNIAATCYLNVGDYIEMFARQTSGGALNVLTNNYSPVLSLSYLGE